MAIEFNLDLILKEKGMSMYEAAKKCKLSYSTFYNIATNKQKQLSLSTLEKISTGLNVKIQDLFRLKKK